MREFERGGEFVPNLEIAQRELHKFRDIVRDLIGKKKWRREYPVKVDNENKILELSLLDTSTKVRLRDIMPTSDNAYVYKAISCTEDETGQLKVAYQHGTLVKDGGKFSDSAFQELMETKTEAEMREHYREGVNALVIQFNIYGEPIDEFGEMMHILGQVKNERDSTWRHKARRLFTRSKNIEQPKN